MGYDNASAGNSGLDYGLNWLCDKSERVLDFGCGDGTMLYLCAARGTQIHIGIDVSPKLITKARRGIDKTSHQKFYFRCGGVTEFKTLLPVSFDAVILSDIVDLLAPEDGKLVLEEVYRVLNKEGKVLLKLSDYSNKPSTVLWNLTTDEWTDVLNAKFIIKECKDLYYKDRDRHERLFLLAKPEQP